MVVCEEEIIYNKIYYILNSRATHKIEVKIDDKFGHISQGNESYP